MCIELSQRRPPIIIIKMSDFKVDCSYICN